MRSILALSTFALVGAFAGLAACAPAPAPTPAPTASAAAPATVATAAPDAFHDSLMTPHPEGEKGVYFVNLTDGQEVSSPFRVIFGLYGLGVAPAGIDKPDTGHHHLIVDHDMTPQEMEEMIPKDDHHLHFGGGQTETVLTLPPGKHTLQLVVADKDHVPLKPAVASPKITVTVK